MDKRDDLPGGEGLVAWIIPDGAVEIDMVINRGAFLSGDYQTVFDEIVQIKEACGDAAGTGGHAAGLWSPDRRHGTHHRRVQRGL